MLDSKDSNNFQMSINFSISNYLENNKRLQIFSAAQAQEYLQK